MSDTLPGTAGRRKTEIEGAAERHGGDVGKRIVRRFL